MIWYVFAAGMSTYFFYSNWPYLGGKEIILALMGAAVGTVVIGTVLMITWTFVRLAVKLTGTWKND